MKMRFIWVGVMIGSLLLGAGCSSENELFEGASSSSVTTPSGINAGVQIQAQ